MSKLILITRPIEDAKKIEADIIKMGHKAFIEPLLEIKPHQVSIEDLNAYSGLIFTSRNAVRVFTQLSAIRDIPIYVVGENTRKSARTMGFSKVILAGDTVRELTNALPAGHYWHGRGQDVTMSITQAFEHNYNVIIEEKILYHAEKHSKFSDECFRHIKNQDFDEILFFSARTAEAFVACYRRDFNAERALEGLKQTKALCLSSSMIKCLSEIKWQDIAVADKPNRQSLLTLI